MNQLLINIVKRLTCKAIEVNASEYKIDVSFKYIGDSNAISVTLFDEDFNNSSFYFYDDDKHNEGHLSQFRYILRKIRKRQI